MTSRKRKASLTDKVTRKVRGIFREMEADRFRPLADKSRLPQYVIARAFLDDFGFKVSRDIGTCVVNWYGDARFVAALTLYPDRFTKEEIRWGVIQYLRRVPNHVASIVKFGGYPLNRGLRIDQMCQNTSEK